VEEAFRIGAQGYVHKLRAQVDLMPAIEAVLAGKRFVSSDLEYSNNVKPQRRHEIEFYSDDAGFVERATHFLAGALKTGGAAIVFATNSHRESLVERLKADGFDMNSAIQQGTYISLNATEAVSNMTVNGLPDHDRWLKDLSGVIESCVRATKTEHPRIALFGEGTSLLWAQGNKDAAIQIETICNDLLEELDLDILCAFPQSVLRRADDARALESICSQHTAVFSH
jgi:hypothetical protein